MEVEMNRKYSQSVIVVTLVILFSIGCGMFTGTAQPQQMGTIKIVNSHVRGSDPFPGGMYLPDAREYGVCIITYPAVAGITQPTFDVILAKDGEETNYALPAGTYTLQEFQTDSEINQDPLYLPAVKHFVRPPEIVVLAADETLVFGSQRTLPAPGDFAEGTLLNSNCLGASQQIGVIKVVNNHVRGGDEFPGGTHLPDAREYGVCIIAYPPVDGITKPDFDMILAKDGQITTYGLPSGTYTLQEWQFDSEINQDPLYSPAVKNYVRPVEVVVLMGNATLVFGSERTLPAPGDFVEGTVASSNCLGVSEGPGVFPTKTPTVTPTATLTATPNPTEVAYVGGFAGVWDTNWGEMTCSVDGLVVHCEYTHDQGRIDATLSADRRTMEGQWAESPSYSPPNDGGRVAFTLSEDGTAISGDWSYGQGSSQGSWTGTRK
jgi:hypothetical protein